MPQGDKIDLKLLLQGLYPGGNILENRESVPSDALTVYQEGAWGEQSPRDALRDVAGPEGRAWLDILMSPATIAGGVGSALIKEAVRPAEGTPQRAMELSQGARDMAQGAVDLWSDEALRAQQGLPPSQEAIAASAQAALGGVSPILGAGRATAIGRSLQPTPRDPTGMNLAAPTIHPQPGSSIPPVGLPPRGPAPGPQVPAQTLNPAQGPSLPPRPGNAPGPGQRSQGPSRLMSEPSRSGLNQRQKDDFKKRFFDAVQSKGSADVSLSDLRYRGKAPTDQQKIYLDELRQMIREQGGNPAKSADFLRKMSTPTSKGGFGAKFGVGGAVGTDLLLRQLLDNPDAS